MKEARRRLAEESKVRPTYKAGHGCADLSVKCPGGRSQNLEPNVMKPQREATEQISPSVFKAFTMFYALISPSQSRSCLIPTLDANGCTKWVHISSSHYTNEETGTQRVNLRPVLRGTAEFIYFIYIFNFFSGRKCFNILY